MTYCRFPAPVPTVSGLRGVRRRTLWACGVSRWGERVGRCNEKPRPALYAPTMDLMTTWRVAASLTVLLRQINAAFPGRGTGSDGTIGDKAHQAEGKASDHNPWVVDSRGIGVVRALDITHDPAHGCDTYALAGRLRLAHDHRVSYLISNRRITGPGYGWTWAAYTGPDPHTGHMHVSVSVEQALYDNTDPWGGIIMAAVDKRDQEIDDIHYAVTQVINPTTGDRVPLHVALGAVWALLVQVDALLNRGSGQA